MPDGRIVMTADMTQVLNEAEKVSDKHKEIGGHAGKIGEHWIRINEHISHAALHALAIGTVWKETLSGMDQYASKVTELSKKGGAAAFEQAKAIDNLGLGQTESAQARGNVSFGQGAASQEERTEGIKALADYSIESRRTIPSGQITQYINLVNSGLYTSEELIKLIRRGSPLPTMAEQVEKLSRMGGLANLEAATRTQEVQKKNEAAMAAISTGRGLANRAYDAQEEVDEVNQPGKKFIQHRAELITGRQFSVGAAVSYDISGTNGIVNAIQAQTRALSPQPRVNPISQGEQK